MVGVKVERGVRVGLAVAGREGDITTEGEGEGMGVIVEDSSVGVIVGGTSIAVWAGSMRCTVQALDRISIVNQTKHRVIFILVAPIL